MAELDNSTADIHHIVQKIILMNSMLVINIDQRPIVIKFNYDKKKSVERELAVS